MIAEETGQIRAIDEWVLRSACEQAQRWRAKGLPPLRMAVNPSGCPFKRADFIEMIDRTLAETGHEGRLLELEVTEGR